MNLCRLKKLITTKQYIEFYEILVVLYLLYLIAFILVAAYAPADTVKRPLIKKKRRIRFKILSVIVVISYFIITLLITNNLIINVLIFGLIIECILISPLNISSHNSTIFLLT